jgi:hypothetical protein
MLKVKLVNYLLTYFTKSSEALPLQGRRYPNEFGYFSLLQGRVSVTNYLYNSVDSLNANRPGISATARATNT